MKITCMKDSLDDLVEGIKDVMLEMKEKGYDMEKVTFEEISDYAGRHVLIIESVDKKP